MKEIWKDIPNYESRYQVSNLGNVRSLNYNHTGKCKLLKPSTDSDGYKQVALYIGGTIKQKWFRVHRLVAFTFIPNPNNLPFVNHKDENPSNNCVDNLEWCTYKYNNEYNGRIDKCKHKISATLKSKEAHHRMTLEQIEHIRQGAYKGWETRRRNQERKEV